MDILGGLSTDIKLSRFYFKAINAKVVGAIQLGTIPPGRILIPIFGFTAIRSAVGVTSAPSLSMGANSPTYNDIMAATPLTGLLSGNVAPLPFRAQYPFLVPGTQVFVNVTAAAVASGAYSIDWLILGVWL